jgi:hypothetical protein
MYGSEKKQTAVAENQKYWLVDDSAWLSRRKEEWKRLVAEVLAEESAQDIRIFGEYFVYGRLIDYIPAVTLYLYTPYDSATAAKSVFESDLFAWQERRRILESYVFSGPKYAPDMPWIREHIQLFLQGVLGQDYVEIKEHSGRSEKTISSEPTAWCMAYVADARKLMDGKVSYAGSMDCLDYFVSALKHASNPSVRRFVDPGALISRAESLLADSDVAADVLDFAKEISSRKDEIISNWEVSGE